MADFDCGHNGYIGTLLSGAKGKFSLPQTVTVQFPKSYPETLPGVTIRWSSTYGEWATKFRVTAYHSGRVVFVQDAEGHGLETVVTGDIAGYDKIDITITEWSKPFSRARMEDLFLGIRKTYAKPDIMSFSASMTVDPLSASLPKAEVSFELKNLNGEFNIDNPRNTQKYLMERQQLTVRYGYRLGKGIEWIPGGTYYLSEWDTPQNGITAAFTARDALEFMDDPYTGPSTGTMLDIAKAAFEQADLPLMKDGSPRWMASSSLASVNAPDGADLSRKTIAQVLQLCANAGCCVFFQDRNGVVRIEPMVGAFTDYRIDRFNSYANSEIKLSKELKAVDINNGQLVYPAGLKGVTQPVSNELISDTQAQPVADWTADYLSNRRMYSGAFRADPRLDPLDIVKNENQYATTTVLVTTIRYTYNGAFRGSYEGRGLESGMAVFLYSGEPLAISGLTFPQGGGA